ncbi:MAG: M1 family metallopeptidase [Bacteroidota bacterium]
MKKAALIIVFLLFTCFCYLNGFLQDKAIAGAHTQDTYHFTKYKNGLSSGETVRNAAAYFIDAELNPAENTVTAREKIIWTNLTSDTANTIVLHLYPNAFRNPHTEFFKNEQLSFAQERYSGIFFSEVNERGVSVSITYPGSDHGLSSGIRVNCYDSTVGVIRLKKPVVPGGRTELNFQFTVKLPKACQNFGYAAGRNFFMLAQWYPQVGIFQNGKWVSYRYYHYADFYSDFADYDLTLRVPANYTAASTGLLWDKKIAEGMQQYRFVQPGINDLAVAVSDKFSSTSENYRSRSGADVLINVYMQPENSKYCDRYLLAVKNSLAFMEKYIGAYPYKTISVVDVPKTSHLSAASHPTLITVRADLFSPSETHQPEKDVIAGITKQYFAGVLSNDRISEAWLDEAVSLYLSNRIAVTYYGQRNLSFKLFGYYPIFGLNLLSYNEIPLIYSLGAYHYPEEAELLSEYYMSPSMTSIAGNSLGAPDRASYRVAVFSKPALMLHSLERNIGFDKMMDIFRLYYNRNKFRTVTFSDFMQAVRSVNGSSMDWFFDNLYRSTSRFDYCIRELRQTEKNTYEVFAERAEDGIFSVDVALYTDRDTLFEKWDGKERWKKITFRTSGEVLGAEIDPFRKNLLDINYSNNSYMVHNQYGGSISVSLRWFFWVQNLILILGSVA